MPCDFPQRSPWRPKVQGVLHLWREGKWGLILSEKVENKSETGPLLRRRGISSEVLRIERLPAHLGCLSHTLLALLSTKVAPAPCRTIVEEDKLSSAQISSPFPFSSHSQASKWTKPRRTGLKPRASWRNYVTWWRSQEWDLKLGKPLTLSTSPENTEHYQRGLLSYWIGQRLKLEWTFIWFFLPSTKWATALKGY